MTEPLIRSIADTARWVAYHRATESDRADSLFKDPFARHLAGERGALIGSTLRDNAAFIALRTLIFDTLIVDLVDRGSIDTVVNLAAGLDTRPYRLRLPPSLRWVEIDLPEIVEIKKALMAGETPACTFEMIAADLSAPAIRRRIFADLNDIAASTLVLSEGLLTYLTDHQVTALAADLLVQPTFKWWMVEVVSPQTLQFIRRTWGKHLEAAGASMHFSPADWRRFYASRGWKIADFRDLERESVRVGRTPENNGVKRKLGRLARTIARASSVFPQWAGHSESGVALLRG
jgi:methyltransferase (TIGR00027 family)